MVHPFQCRSDRMQYGTEEANYSTEAGVHFFKIYFESQLGSRRQRTWRDALETFYCEETSRTTPAKTRVTESVTNKVFLSSFFPLQGGGGGGLCTSLNSSADVHLFNQSKEMSERSTVQLRKRFEKKRTPWLMNCRLHVSRQARWTDTTPKIYFYNQTRGGFHLTHTSVDWRKGSSNRLFTYIPTSEVTDISTADTSNTRQFKPSRLINKNYESAWTVPLITRGMTAARKVGFKRGFWNPTAARDRL